MDEKKIKALAQEIMQECEKEGEPVTEEEAVEMAKMEIGSKEVRRYEKADTPRKKSVKERKVDPDKLALCAIIGNALTEAGIESTQHNESAFHFDYLGKAYTIKLTQHRPQK